tara:strand:+ start:991 stop:1758 length:768 start_codon:yes stop_codon:yes gene_type:complete
MQDGDSLCGDDLIIGVHSLREALRAVNVRLDQVLIRQGPRNRQHDEIFRLARVSRVPVKFVPSEALNRLARSLKHQGVLGHVSQKAYVSLDTVLEKAETPEMCPFFLVLDGVEDPRNMGAIIRTAEGAGVSGVIISDRRAVGMTGVVARASAGALEHVTVARVSNLSQSIERLKSRHVWVYGLDPHASKSYLDLDYRGPIAVVIGGEGKGIRPGLLKRCDDRVAIPMQGTVASLNVSVAAAVMFYEVVRQRGGSE